VSPSMSAITTTSLKEGVREIFPEEDRTWPRHDRKKAGEEVVERLDRRENDQDEQKRKRCVVVD
jgi:hypothetical protein